MPHPEIPDGTRMSYWLATTLKEAREREGLSRADIARPLGVNDVTIKRLESGRSMGRDIDRYVAAYAFVLGLEDGRVLWEKATRDYRRHGSPPLFSVKEGSPAYAFAQALREVALRNRPHDGAPSASQRATPKKRAAG